MTVSVIACFAPENFVIDHTDCRDDLKQVHPGATEICNELDDNCNGQTDEGVKIISYQDADHDGYGNLLVKHVTCVLAPADVTNSTDCDDTRASVHPDSSEICDELDNNCNGITDEGVLIAFYQDADGDTFGNVLTKKMACLPGPQDVTNSTDCDDTHASVYPKAPEICDGFDNDCNGQTDEGVQTTYFADVDQDGYGNLLVTKMACTAPSGYGLNSTDCNDLDKFVHPNAIEICNKIDDNCDGQTDEGVLLTFYADADQDKYGNLSQEVTGCTAPNGYVANSADCNDSNKNIHPNAVELCSNKIDDDCDGITDNAIEATLWCQDKDKDGYGNCAVSLYACTTPTGFVADNSDCNDANALVHPNAIEICTDGIDNNCNGVTDTDAIQVLWYEDSDGDKFGNPKISKLACSPPPNYVDNALDCSDTNASINPGAKEVCNNGIDDNCDGSVNQCKFGGVQSITAAQTQIHGNANNLYLDTVVLADVNGDKKDDLIVTVIHDSTAGNETGAVYLFLGPIASGDLSLNDANTKWTGEAPSDQAGSSVSVGDFNGDGKADILIGALNAKNGLGVVYLILGSDNPVGGSLSKVSIQWSGQFIGDQAGYSLSTADVNGDGKDDILIGAPGVGNPENESGSVYLILGSDKITGGSLSSAYAKWTGETKNDFTAKLVNKAGDINGDGKADVVITSPLHGANDNQEGALYLILGSANLVSGSLSTVAIKWTGEKAGDHAGHSVDVGDIDGDGKADILIGSPLNNSSGPHAGSAYLILGSSNPIGGSLSTASAKWTGENENDLAGSSVSTGDVNSDGKLDILIGSPVNKAAGNYSGAVYLILGSLKPISESLSNSSSKWTGQINSQLGRGCSLQGDANDDGYKDIIGIAPYLDFNGTDDSMIYILHSLGL